MNCKCMKCDVTLHYSESMIDEIMVCNCGQKNVLPDANGAINMSIHMPAKASSAKTPPPILKKGPEWVYVLDNSKSGPFSDQEMGVLIGKEIVKRDTFVSNLGSRDSKPAIEGARVVSQVSDFQPREKIAPKYRLKQS